MQTATLIVSSLALGVGVVNLAIMLKVAGEAQKAQKEVEDVKSKVSYNAGVVKAALRSLEL